MDSDDMLLKGHCEKPETDVLSPAPTQGNGDDNNVLLPDENLEKELGSTCLKQYKISDCEPHMMTQEELEMEIKWLEQRTARGSSSNMAHTSHKKILTELTTDVPITTAQRPKRTDKNVVITSTPKTKEFTILLSKKEAELSKEILLLKTKLKRVEEENATLKENFEQLEMEMENMQNEYAQRSSLLLHDAMAMKNIVGQSALKAQKFMQQHYDKQRAEGKFRFGKITVDSKTLDKLYKHFKHIPGVCFARTLELVRGRKYCLKHVLMGTHQVKGGFEVKEREDLITFCRFHVTKPVTRLALNKAYGTWRSQHWPRKPKLFKAPIMDVLNELSEATDEDVAYPKLEIEDDESSEVNDEQTSDAQEEEEEEEEMNEDNADGDKSDEGMLV